MSNGRTPGAGVPGTISSPKPRADQGRLARRVASLMLCFLMVHWAVPPRGFADGCPSYYDDTEWRLLSEDLQAAFVLWENGQETLLLDVSLGQDISAAQATQVVWVTPIPAPAQEVEVDVLPSFPTLDGSEPTARLAADARLFVGLTLLTQIYTMPVFLYLFTMSAGSDVGVGEVTVHDEIARDGVTLQLVTAQTAEALDDFLLSLGVHFPAEGLQALQPYTGESSSFAIHRITDLSAYRRATDPAQWRMPRLGVMVRFPTERGFFPLVASSAIPGDTVAVVVHVIGFHQAIEPIAGLSTQHYVGSLHTERRLLASVPELANLNNPLEYTRFELVGPPRDLTVDLEFSPGAPESTRWAAEFITGESYHSKLIVAVVCLFFLFSIASTVLMRWVWPRPQRPSVKLATLLGLVNGLTVIGLLVASVAVARKRQVSLRRCLGYVALASLTFCVLVVAFNRLLAGLA